MRNSATAFVLALALTPYAYGEVPPEQSFLMRRAQSEVTEVWSFRCIFGDDHPPLCTACTQDDNGSALWKMVRASRHDRGSYSVVFVQPEADAKMCAIMHMTKGPTPEIVKVEGTLTTGGGAVIEYSSETETEPAACTKNPRRPSR